MSPADDVVPDRLAEELRREARRIGSSRLSDLALISADEVERLIAENERLRAESANAYELAETFRGKANAAADEIERLIGATDAIHREALRGWATEVEALRGALQALVDATATVQLSSSERFSEYAIWTTHLQYGFDNLAAARAVAVGLLTGQEPT